MAPLVLPTSDRHISPGEISPEPDVGQKWLQSGTAVTAALTAWERLNVQKWNRDPLGAEGERKPTQAPGCSCCAAVSTF